MSDGPAGAAASAGLPQAPGVGAGCHTRLSQLHGDTGGGTCGCTAPYAWVDAEYKALHGLRLVLDRLKEGSCIDVTPSVRVEIAFID